MKQIKLSMYAKALNKSSKAWQIMIQMIHTPLIHSYLQKYQSLKLILTQKINFESARLFADASFHQQNARKKKVAISSKSCD